MAAPPGSSRRTRIAGGVLAWVAAVVAATAVGMTAVGAIGSGIVESGPQPLDAAEVSRRLAAAPTPGPTGPPTPVPSPATSSGAAAPAAPGAATVIPTDAGTVIASCAGGLVRVVSASPAQGWQLAELEQGGDHPSIRFTSGRDRVEVRLRCRGGAAPEVEIRND